ncbi:hypothetical protein L5D93_26605 [Paenibacillus thiaminolyticus]|nr:hypothetical protein [Paenibacillus thiaminolyticus]
MQKFYRSIARRFIPSDDLLPSHELIETSRQVFLETVLTTRNEIEQAPPETFQLTASNQEVRKNIASTHHFHATEAQFTSFIQEFKELYKKHFKDSEQMPGSDAKPYMMTLIAFQRQDSRPSVFGKGEEDS